MPSEHIVKAFDQELAKLKQAIFQMGGLAEAQLEASMICIARRDASRAAEVIAADARLDEYDHWLNDEAVRILALRQPMANDLREVVAGLKITADLERMGDYAANIAKRAIALSEVPAVRPASNIPRMGRLAQAIVKDVLDAYSERNLSKALAAWERDEELDELYTSLFREILTYMMEDPRNITPCTHLLFIAKNIERIGDHATNIAEIVHFLVAGKPIRAERPKDDRSNFTVVTPGDVEPTGTKDDD